MSGNGPFDTDEDRTSDALSEQESTDLAKALGDGFQVYGSLMPGVSYTLAGILEEPYFGASAGNSHTDIPSKPEFVQGLEDEGCTAEEIGDEIEWYLDELVSDDAPHWRETSPFNFSMMHIKQFFIKQFCSYMKYDEGKYGVDFFARDCIGRFRVYTRIWFEILILQEIELFELFARDLNRKNNQITLRLAMSKAGEIGRIVEHYRWRFSYGSDALRGRANISAARVGGVARAQMQRARSQSVIYHMESFLDRGHSISNAAELAFKSGQGTSAAANKRLWTRHRKK